MTPMTDSRIAENGRDVVRIEAEALLSIIDRIGEDFTRAVELIYHSKGRVIVAGIGKSGLIARKIVATMRNNFV